VVSYQSCSTLATSEAEDALRQAQKLESVRQMTGVAHYFNNLLTIIGRTGLPAAPLARRTLTSPYRSAVAIIWLPER
jgi:hypothetical protein